MFGRKKRILRKVIKSQVAMVRDMEEACRQGRVPADDCMQVLSRWDVIKQSLNKIAPPEPVSLKQKLLRTGVVLLLLLMAGGFYYHQNRYLFVEDPGAVVVSGKESDGLVERFVPALIASRSDQDILEFTNKFGPIVIAEDTDLTLTNVGVMEEDDTVRSLLLKRDGLDVVLIGQEVSPDPFKVVGEPYELLRSPTMVDADLFSHDGVQYLASIEQIDVNKQKLSFYRFTSFKELSHIASSELPSGDDFVGSKIGTRVDSNGSVSYLVGGIRKMMSGSIEIDAPVVKYFDSSFTPVSEHVFDSRGYSCSLPYFVDGSNPDILKIYTTASDPLQQGEVTKGDELYVFSYDHKNEIIDFLRVTNTGLPEILGVSTYVDRNGKFIMPYHRIDSVHGELAKTRFYPDAGNLSLTILNGKTVNGGEIIKQYKPWSEGDDRKMASKNAHLFEIDGNLYLQYDEVITLDVYTEKDTRTTYLYRFILDELWL